MECKRINANLLLTMAIVAFLWATFARLADTGWVGRIWSRGLGGGLEGGAAAGYNVGLKRWSYRSRVGWQRLASRAVLEYGRGPMPRTPSDSYTLLLNSGQFLRVRRM